MEWGSLSHTPTAWRLSKVQENPPSSQTRITLTGWDPKMLWTARLLDISVSLWSGQLATVSAVFLAICTTLIRQWEGVKVTLVSAWQMSLWTWCPWRDPSLWLKELQWSEQSGVQLHNTEQHGAEGNFNSWVTVKCDWNMKENNIFHQESLKM